MRLAFCLIVLLLAVDCTAAAELKRPTGESIVSPDAKLELLFTRTAAINGGLTEGPAVAPDGSVYFTDIPVGKDPGMIMRFDPKTRNTTAFSRDSGKANGLAFDAEGFLVACEGSDSGGPSSRSPRTAANRVANGSSGLHYRVLLRGHGPLWASVFAESHRLN